MAEENAKLKGQVEKLTANGKIALEKLQEKMKESTEGTRLPIPNNRRLATKRRLVESTAKVGLI